MVESVAKADPTEQAHLLSSPKHIKFETPDTVDISTSNDIVKAMDPLRGIRVPERSFKTHASGLLIEPTPIIATSDGTSLIPFGTMALADAPSSFSLQKQEPPAPDMMHDADAAQNGAHTRNVVLFGETGVGKSSLINLIADKLLAQTSNDALGCTVEPRPYDVTFPFDSGDASGSGSVVNVTLWDTAGLDEGTHGAVPATVAAARLKALLHTLARSPSGVHLLLFCIRGTTRLTRTLSQQYNLVYASICRKKVPIALVVTGLEHLHPHEPAAAGMERWWTAHENEVKHLGMRFAAHACVTTVEVGTEGIGQERWLVSQRRLRKIVVAYVGTVGWRIGSSWRSVVVSALWCIHKSLGLNGEGEGDTSGVRRYYAALKRWLANIVKGITDRDPATLLKTIA